MDAPPRVDIELAGTRVVGHGPERARAVLEAEVWHTTNVVDSVDDVASIPDVSGLIRWCATRTDRIEHEELGKIDNPGDKILDTALPIRGILDLKNHLVDSVSMSEQQLDELKDYYHTVFGGGCSCPACDEDSKITHDDFIQDGRDPCEFSGISDHTYHLASVASGIAETDLLDAPWYLYQLHQVRKAGKAQAMEDRREERERKQEAQNALKRNGLKSGYS